jgi:TM2 domain-containing membrane protein YozV
MKKQILSALCSGLVVPGLGQILNRHIKKGIALLAIVFILFIIETIQLAILGTTLLEDQALYQLDTVEIMQRLQDANLSVLWILVGIFAIVWLYSVLDAFWGARTLNNKRKGEIA